MMNGQYFADIILKREELVQHCRDAAYVLARSKSAKSDNPSRDDNWLIDIFQRTRNGGGNDELATRAMNLAASYVDAKLSELCQDFYQGDGECCCCQQVSKPIHFAGRVEQTDMLMTDELRFHEAYQFRIWFPEGTLRSKIRLIKNLAHEFVVYSTLANWAMLSNVDDVEKLFSIVTALEEKLRDAIDRLDEVVTRPMWPIW